MERRRRGWPGAKLGLDLAGECGSALRHVRITLVTETFFPQVNGVSRTLGQLVRVLEASGDRVQVIQPDYGAPPRSRADVLVDSVSLPFYEDLRLPIPPFFSVARAITAFQPDLVHIATEATLGLGMLRHCLRAKTPVVSSFHTNFDQYSSHYRIAHLSGVIWRYLRWLHNQTIETYVPSNATIADLAQRGFERLALWPRGVDAATFRPDRPGRTRIRREMGARDDDVVVGHVSRIAAEKNVGYLADALAALVAARPRVKLLIVGDGPEKPMLEERLGEFAMFAGYRTGEDLADHFAAADVFAFASLTETFGNVILEAMASGLPVVAVRAGGPADTVRPGVTGELIEPTEPPASFARGLIRIVDDSRGRQRLAQAAREYALAQSWDSIMEGLRGRYRAAVGAYRSNSA